MKNAFIVHEPRYFPSVKSNADGTPRGTLLHGFMARTSCSRVINCIQFILINYLITRGHGSASRNRSWQSLEARLLGFRVAEPLTSVRVGDRLRLTSPCRLFGTRKENRAQFVHRSLTCVRAVKIHHYGHHDFNHIVTRYTGCISHRNRSDVGFYHLISVYRWNYYFARGRRVQRQSLDCSNTVVERTSATDFSHRDLCIPDAVGELITYHQRSRISGLRL